MKNRKENRKLASDIPKKDGDWRRVDGKLVEGNVPSKDKKATPSETKKADDMVSGQTANIKRKGD